MQAIDDVRKFLGSVMNLFFVAEQEYSGLGGNPRKPRICLQERLPLFSVFWVVGQLLVLGK